MTAAWGIVGLVGWFATFVGGYGAGRGNADNVARILVAGGFILISVAVIGASL